ncbi:AHH domain-containing protein [Bradyrhizobium sp. CCBAU 25338]|uniref:AHH domain-containing protein n=1 Tax=Bradyrhizobium sp. CCBAU 25338 TaxID=1641877 RepID=UPI0023040666|nr:AHH domain-containing protein [Bradyrhizobium sp. CCBAU 25338]
MSIFFDHHIILDRFRDHRAFRGIDKKAFDIDSPANRIYLPADPKIAAKLNVSPHPGNHIDSYVEAVGEKLDAIKEIESPSKRTAEIRTLIDAMRVGFLNGDLYTNWPIDKTREEVNLSNAKVLSDHKAYLAQYPDQLRAIRDIEQRGTNAGLDHLIKWLLFLDNPERRKLLDEVIARNPDVNITAGNRNLGGTDWSKFEAPDPSSDTLRIPGSTPANPSDFPPLPGYSSPPLAGLDEQEGFTRSDPRVTRALPPFPTLDPNEQRLGQLPPTTAAPTDPLVLQSDPHSGTALPFYENPFAGGTSPARGLLPWLAGAAALGAAAPFVPAWLLAIGGTLALTRAANAQESSSDPTMGAAAPGGGVFSAGASAFNTNGDRLNVHTPAGSSNSSGSSAFVPRLGEASSFDPETPASNFADRFGNWASTAVGTVPAKDLPEAAAASAAGSVAPEDVRRLTRVNETNAGSVFSSGSAPVPYLPSTEFNERFGSWTVSPADGQHPQPSKPIGIFADEPSYLIPPPIFGVDGPGNPHNDGEEWFSRWIRPLLRPE